MPRLLVVDDEPSISWGLARIGESLGCDVSTASTAEEGIEFARRSDFDAIVTDVRLPGMSGLEAVPHWKQLNPRTPIIVITAWGDLGTAIEAVRQGAFEYIIKPFQASRMRTVLERALGERHEAAPVAPDSRAAVSGFVGQSWPMQEVFSRVALAAASDANVLLLGESGTGKELAARAIHQFSARSGGPFVVVNLAAINRELAESELFGHVQGAFTGASQDRQGLLVQAHGGTLFLDEIADIPPSIQVKLLRAVEQREVLPVGTGRPVEADFRIVSATHRNMNRLIQEGIFRHDLYFRLSSFRIDLPPLRDRGADIELLARHFVEQSGREPIPLISDAALADLKQRKWWGNVRELRNAIEHALIVSRGATITPDHLPPAFPPFGRDSAPEGDAEQARKLLAAWTREAIARSGQQKDLYDRFLQLVEPPLFETLLEYFGGQMSPAARLLGVHRGTLRKKLEALGLYEAMRDRGEGTNVFPGSDATGAGTDDSE
jgi:two-component system nitrogen regulation response regulator GlnG